MSPKFGVIYRDAYGREKPCYELPEREVLVLITSYSIPMRAAALDRLKELEAKR